MLKALATLLMTGSLGAFGMSIPDSDIAFANQPFSLSAKPVVELSQSRDAELLYLCETTNGKLLELYDLGDTIRYSFGPPNNSEIVLDVPRHEASTYQWAGVGRSIHYSVSVPNGDTIYTVFISQDRLTEGRPVTGGVDVYINDEYTTSVYCADENIISNLEGVDLKPSY
ncbi:MAG: hypothetical protein AAFX01_00150 [Cyanobacteria bacterium J06638_28]